MGLSNKHGLTDALLEYRQTKKLNVEYFQSVNDPSFAGTMAVLTSGIHIPNPSELLGSHVFKDYINELKKSFDFIIIDCAPIGMISDAIPVGNAVDGTIFAISSQDTNKKDAANCVKLLQRNNVNVLGSVLQKQNLYLVVITTITNMKKVTFSITVVVLLAMIVGLIGYDRFSTSQNAKKYQSEEKTTTTTKEETTKTKTKKKKNSQRIYCIGDSFTLGSEFASYPLNLESLTNSEIIKFGGNQDTTFDLSIRVGRTKIFANNITIPGDKEAVDLTFYNEKGEQIEALKNSGSNFDEVTIQGIKGTLAYDSSRNIHTFTRDKSGKAVTLTAPAQIEATLPEFNENDIVIVFSGNYDKQNNQDVYRTITYQRAILNQIKTQKYIVVSMTSKRQNNLVRDDNNILKEEHKDHFLDFRTYLLTNGLKDANITATEQDQKDLTNSYIPSSLLKEDKFAGNDTFNQLLANQIYQKLQELQYIK